MCCTSSSTQHLECIHIILFSTVLVAILYQSFGSLIRDSSKHVLNLSDYTLSDTERFVLAHGFGLSIPNKNIKREEVFADFELLSEQLSKHYAVSIEADQTMKARLCDLAYADCWASNDLSDF